MSLEFWKTLIESSALAALCGFAIWIIRCNYQQQLRERDDRLRAERTEHRELREQLVQVIERNTAGWQDATKTMADIATGVAMLVATMDYNREAITGIRVLLARRPCIGDEAYKIGVEIDRDLGDEPGGGHPRPAPGSSPRS